MTLCLNREGPIPSNTSPQSQHPQPGSQLDQGQSLAHSSLSKQDNPLERSEVLFACFSDLAANLRRGCGCSSRHPPSNKPVKGAGSRPIAAPCKAKESQPPTWNPASLFLRSPPTTRGDIEQRVSGQQHLPRHVPTMTFNSTQQRHCQAISPNITKIASQQTGNQVHPNTGPSPPDSTPRPAGWPPRQRSIQHSVVINVVKTERLNSIAQAYPLRTFLGPLAACSSRGKTTRPCRYQPGQRCGIAGNPGWVVCSCCCSTARAIFPPA